MTDIKPPIDLVSMIHDAVMKQPNKQWPIFDSNKNLDRSEVITSSEVGYCERKIKYDKLALKERGYVPEEGTSMSRDWGFFERGHAVEAWVINLLKQQLGEQLKYSGEKQVSFVIGNQAGTPDGIIDIGSPYILEIKSIDPRTNPRNLPRQPHVSQLIQNADLVSYHLNPTQSPIGGVILYVDASNYQILTPFHVDFDDDHAEKLEARADRIMEANSPADLKPEGMFNGDCKVCPHTARCSMLQAELRNEGTRHDEITKAKDGFFSG